MAKQVICLDLDGTLISTELCHVKAFQDAFTKNGYPSKSNKSKRGINKSSIKFTMVGLLLLPRKKEVEKISADKVQFVINDTYRYAKQIPGVVEALRELKGSFRLAVITNSNSEEAKLLLSTLKLPSDFFDDVVSADQVEKPKPDADEILKVERDLKSKVLYVVGDSVYDIKAGKAAGAKTIAVLSGQHSSKQLFSAKPTNILKSVADLPDLVFDRL